MSFTESWPTRLMLLAVVPVVVLAFLTAAGDALPMAVVYADPGPCTATLTANCTIGNLEVLSFTSFSGSACADMGSTFTGSILDDSTGSGFSTTANIPCTLSFAGESSFSETGSIEVEGINGYLIDDINGSASCGATTGTLSFELDPGLGGVTPLTLDCPTEPSSGEYGTVSGDISFTPTGGPLTETFTLTGSFSDAGSLTLDSFSDQFSLVPSPEPNTLLLFATGLVGLAGAAYRQLLGRSRRVKA